MTDKTKLVTYVEKAYADKILAHAKSENRTKSNYIESILKEYVDKYLTK